MNNGLRKAAEMALEALENPWKAKPEGVADAIQALRQALAQPEWVGLTEDEKQFFKAMGFSGIDIVEAKLKEKNT